LIIDYQLTITKALKYHEKRSY